MRLRNRKRRITLQEDDQLGVKRTRNDIENSGVSDISNFVSSEDISKIVVQNQTRFVPSVVKKPKSPLHCDRCDQKFTSRESLTRHVEIKSLNSGRQTILPREFKRNGSHVIVCRELNCCFSTRTLCDIYKHDKIAHKNKNFSGTIFKYPKTGDNQGGLISVVNLISTMEDPTQNMCARCLKNYTTKKGLDNHKPKCPGRQLFSCVICYQGFGTHDEMASHVINKHKSDSIFKTTGIFTGRTRKQSPKSGVKQPLTRNSRAGYIFEKTYIPVQSGLTHTSQVITPRVKFDLKTFLKKEVIKNNLLRYSTF